MKVVIAVIANEKNQLLITRRALDKPHGGLWEFPGGKLEEDEKPLDALRREIKEEIGIHIQQASYIDEIIHSYPKHTVEFYIYFVSAYEGKPRCQESQLDMVWVDKHELDKYDFPAANLKIIELIHKDIQVLSKASIDAPTAS